MYDAIVIGAGMAGAVAARILAEEQGKTVLVLEKRAHIGGNCYDRVDPHGIRVHMYGPHIFHTDNAEVFRWLSRFTRWRLFDHQVAAHAGGRLLPLPFNLNALELVCGKEQALVLEEKLRAAFGYGSRVNVLELLRGSDPQLKALAEYIYENIFLYYTIKQWGLKPEEIDPGVVGRVPVVISRDNRYFTDRYQGVPEPGYTELFGRILDHPNINVITGTEAGSLLRISPDRGRIFFKDREFPGPVIYTGPGDELFGFREGRLPYRTVHFEFEYYDRPDFQGRSVINYTGKESFTRITEFKHLTGQAAAGTTIAREYAAAYTGENGEVPCYAIENEKNKRLYRKYADLAGRVKGLYLLGRLAEYKYYNMDRVAAGALALARSLADSAGKPDPA